MKKTKYPGADPAAVQAMRRAMFSARFADEHLSALLGRASMAIADEFHQGLRRHRMPVPHWRILASLSDSDGISLAELGELTLFNQPTVTRLVQRLEKNALVRKSADPHDRRVVRVTLTSTGRERVRELIASATERQQRILEGVDGEALKEALRYLIAYCAVRSGRKPRP